MDLLEILFEALELNPKNYAMWIKYTFELGYTPINIVNDCSIKFYLKIKNNEPDKTKFPLCVDIIQGPMSMMLVYMLNPNHLYAILIQTLQI